MSSEKLIVWFVGEDVRNRRKTIRGWYAGGPKTSCVAHFRVLISLKNLMGLALGAEATPLG